MPAMRLWVALAIGWALAAPALKADALDTLQRRLAMAAEPRILFVGNSYSFKVPGALAQLAQEGRPGVVVERVTRGGWTLRKHAGSKETLARIRGGKWDVVVLQEQSQLPSFSREQRGEQMIPHAKNLVEEIRRAGAVPVFFQTWGRRNGDLQNAGAFPDDTFAKMQARLIVGYREVAEAAGGVLVVPVGEAWAEEMKAGNGKRLYARDGSHPSAAGVLHSARIFYRFFFGE